MYQGDYLIVTRWPLPKVPVFIMGALAGLQVTRKRDLSRGRSGGVHRSKPQARLLEHIVPYFLRYCIDTVFLKDDLNIKELRHKADPEGFTDPNLKQDFLNTQYHTFFDIALIQCS